MKMKLNKRGKILAVVLILVLLIGGYYNFVFSPQRKKLSDLTQQKLEYDTKLRDIDHKIALKNKREQDIKIVYSKVTSITSRLFPEIRQENLIVDIDRLLTENNLKALSIGFSDIKAVPVQKTQIEVKDDKKSNVKNIVDEYNGVQPKKSSNDNSNNNSKADNKDMPSVENMSLNINFIGTYKDLMEFVKSVEAYSKKIVISNLKISQGASDQVTGTMQLEIYAVPKISDEDKDFFKWDFNNSYGKDNPFDGSIGTTGISASIEDIVKNKNQQLFDFVMSVRPTSSELPTVMLGRANDNSKTTYVYADNPKVDNVEIHLAKKDNKYYYKYKTSRDTYPSQYEGNGEEFIPLGNNINFKIYSERRSNDSDIAGANVKLYNDTDKTVNVSIDTDDSAKPRVTISGEGGNVEITRN